MKKRTKIHILLIFLFFSQSTARIRSYWELRFLNIDKQSTEFSCGVAVLATLFTYYYGILVKEEEIMNEFFKKMIEEKRGISFLDMKRFALSKGFDVQGYRLNFAGLVEILKANLPVIVHTKMVIRGKELLHFSLLIGKVDDFLILKDTALGNMFISTYDFLSCWTGYALLIKPTEESKLEEAVKKVEKDKKETRKYVSSIYFYQNHPKRFYRSFIRF